MTNSSKTLQIGMRVTFSTIEGDFEAVVGKIGPKGLSLGDLACTRERTHNQTSKPSDQLLKTAKFGVVDEPSH